ncbi:hypothetical protein VUR80DRAFT_4501 [Thermomyces stellatus]
MKSSAPLQGPLLKERASHNVLHCKRCKAGSVAPRYPCVNLLCPLGANMKEVVASGTARAGSDTLFCPLTPLSRSLRRLGDPWRANRDARGAVVPTALRPQSSETLKLKDTHTVPLNGGARIRTRLRAVPASAGEHVLVRSTGALERHDDVFWPPFVVVRFGQRKAKQREAPYPAYHTQRLKDPGIPISPS